MLPTGVLDLDGTTTTISNPSMAQTVSKIYTKVCPSNTHAQEPVEDVIYTGDTLRVHGALYDEEKGSAIDNAGASDSPVSPVDANVTITDGHNGEDASRNVGWLGILYVAPSVNFQCLRCAHPHLGYQSQVPLAGFNVDSPSYGYPSHPGNPSSVNVPSFDGYGTNTQALDRGNGLDGADTAPSLHTEVDSTVTRHDINNTPSIRGVEIPHVSPSGDAESGVHDDGPAVQLAPPPRQTHTSTMRSFTPFTSLVPRVSATPRLSLTAVEDLWGSFLSGSGAPAASRHSQRHRLVSETSTGDQDDDSAVD
ncbi:hypothetical protein PM082_006177 [Marasmius tenuissimus]|nr:hypothetical protein PM082_006177 [Marasmius tenuissimus]